ncbi:MAG: lysophospholipid acyltransferase family protein [Candidatus Latescibacterota bacterium]
MFSAILYKFGAYLALHLPKQITLFIANLLADIQYATRFKVRRTVMCNLQIIHDDNFSQQQLRQLTRKIFRSFARSIFLFLRSPLLKREDLRNVGNAQDFAELTRKLGNSGFIIATPHLGPWEVGGLWLAANGLTVNTVALDHTAEAVTAFFNQRREHSGLKIFPHRNSFHNLKDALNQGECVALLVDRGYGGASARSRWFGRELELPIGHILLSIRTCKPVLTGAFLFNEDGGFNCEVKGLYYPDLLLTEEEAVEQMQTRCLADFESLIKEHSDQWFHFLPLETSMK